MDPQLANSILAPQTEGAQPPAPGILSANAPITAGALSQQIRQAGALPPKRYQTFQERNAMPGVEFDITTGIPTLAYLSMALNRTAEDRLIYLQGQYGKDNVRQTDTGELVARIPDAQTGKPKDVLVNPRGLNVQDFMELAATMPELAASVAAVGSKKPAPGFFNALKTLGRMAVGAEVTGGVKDVLVRSAEGLPIDPKEIAIGRSELALQDFGWGALFGFGAKALAKARSPFMSQRPLKLDIAQADWDAMTAAERARATSQAPLQFDQESAIEAFTAKGLPGLTRADFEAAISPGMKTGSTFLLRLEGYLRGLPGSSIAFDKIIAAQNALVRKLQNYLLGRSPMPSAQEIAAAKTGEEVGEAALGKIRSTFKPQEEAVAMAKGEAAVGASRELAEMLGTRATPEMVSVVDRPAIGEALRTKAIEERAAFRAEASARYDKLFEHPLAQEKNLPVDDMAGRMKEVLNRMPKAERVVESIDYDQYGNPMLKSTTGQEILKDFIPSGVLAKIQRLSSLKGQKLSLDELKQMRTEVENAIAEGQAIPNMQTHYLGQVQKALTDSIENGIKKLGDPELRALWDDARGFYKTNAPRFQEATISRLFREESQQGFMRGAEIVDEATSSSDSWNAYKKFFGATSPEMMQLQGAVRNRLFTNAYLPGQSTVDAQGFLNGLKQMLTKTPEIAQDTFGRSTGKLNQLAELVGQAEGKIDARELETLARTGNLNYQTFRAALETQEGLDRAYQNRIFRAAAKGDLQSEGIRPSDFVERISRSSKAEVKDTAQVMANIAGDPDLLRQVRSQTVQDILNRSMELQPKTGVSQVMGGEGSFINAPKLIEVLGATDQHQKLLYQTILGADGYQDMVNLAKILMPGQVGAQEFATAGGLARSTMVAQMLHGDLAYVGKFIRNRIVGDIYASHKMVDFISNTRMGPMQTAAFINMFIASEPFLRDTFQQVGVENASYALHEVKRWIDILASGEDPNMPQESPFRMDQLLTKPKSLQPKQ